MGCHPVVDLRRLRVTALAGTSKIRGQDAGG
jgi:hypothetical protein